MVISKLEDVTKQGFCKILCRKLHLRGSLLLVTYSINFGWEVKGVGLGWALIRGWALINFFCLFRAYSRWARIRGWALIRINTVYGPDSSQR